MMYFFCVNNMHPYVQWASNRTHQAKPIIETKLENPPWLVPSEWMGSHLAIASQLFMEQGSL